MSFVLNPHFEVFFPHFGPARHAGLIEPIRIGILLKSMVFRILASFWQKHPKLPYTRRNMFDRASVSSQIHNCYRLLNLRIAHLTKK